MITSVASDPDLHRVAINPYVDYLPGGALDPDYWFGSSKKKGWIDGGKNKNKKKSSSGKNKKSSKNTVAQVEVRKTDNMRPNPSQ